MYIYIYTTHMAGIWENPTKLESDEVLVKFLWAILSAFPSFRYTSGFVT